MHGRGVTFFALAALVVITLYYGALPIGAQRHDLVAATGDTGATTPAPSPSPSAAPSGDDDCVSGELRDITIDATGKHVKSQCGLPANTCKVHITAPGGDIVVTHCCNAAGGCYCPSSGTTCPAIPANVQPKCAVKGAAPTQNFTPITIPKSSYANPTSQVAAGATTISPCEQATALLGAASGSTGSIPQPPVQQPPPVQQQPPVNAPGGANAGTGVNNGYTPPAGSTGTVIPPPNSGTGVPPANTQIGNIGNNGTIATPPVNTTFPGQQPGQPISIPTGQPTGLPTGQPTGLPTGQPTGYPTGAPFPTPVQNTFGNQFRTGRDIQRAVNFFTPIVSLFAGLFPALENGGSNGSNTTITVNETPSPSPVFSPKNNPPIVVVNYNNSPNTPPAPGISIGDIIAHANDNGVPAYVPPATSTDIGEAAPPVELPPQAAPQAQQVIASFASTSASTTPIFSASSSVEVHDIGHAVTIAEPTGVDTVLSDLVGDWTGGNNGLVRTLSALAQAQTQYQGAVAQVGALQDAQAAGLCDQSCTFSLQALQSELSIRHQQIDQLQSLADREEAASRALPAPTLQAQRIASDVVINFENAQLQQPQASQSATEPAPVQVPSADEATQTPNDQITSYASTTATPAYGGETAMNTQAGFGADTSATPTPPATGITGVVEKAWNFVRSLFTPAPAAAPAETSSSSEAQAPQPQHCSLLLSLFGRCK